MLIMLLMTIANSIMKKTLIMMVMTESIIKLRAIFPLELLMTLIIIDRKFKQLKTVATLAVITYE